MDFPGHLYPTQLGAFNEEAKHGRLQKSLNRNFTVYAPTVSSTARALKDALQSQDATCQALE